MKKFTLSDDRIVIVKKIKGCLTIMVKQKVSNVKFVEFTPNRCVVSMFVPLLPMLTSRLSLLLYSVVNSVCSRL